MDDFDYRVAVIAYKCFAVIFVVWIVCVVYTLTSS